MPIRSTSRRRSRKRRNPSLTEAFTVGKRELNRSFEEGFQDGFDHPDIDPDSLLAPYLRGKMDEGFSSPDAYILSHAYYLGFLTAESLREEM